MRPALGLAALLLLAACGGRDMDDQAKYEVYEAAALFFDGSAMQHPVPARSRATSRSSGPSCAPGRR